jgi:hypothetical protein
LAPITVDPNCGLLLTDVSVARWDFTDFSGYKAHTSGLLVTLEMYEYIYESRAEKKVAVVCVGWSAKQAGRLVMTDDAYLAQGRLYWNTETDKWLNWDIVPPPPFFKSEGLQICLHSRNSWNTETDGEII